MSDIDIVLMCFNEQINHHWDYWFLVFSPFLCAYVRVRACTCVLVCVRVLGCHQNWHSLLTKILKLFALQFGTNNLVWDEVLKVQWEHRISQFLWKLKQCSNFGRILFWDKKHSQKARACCLNFYLFFDLIFEKSVFQWWKSTIHKQPALSFPILCHFWSVIDDGGSKLQKNDLRNGFLDQWMHPFPNLHTRMV